jgi:uncharacterized membrane protein YdbT with pleckstrin-like domain
MSYVRHVLQPDERLLADGRLHWIGYWRAIACALGAAVVFGLNPQTQSLRVADQALVAALAALALVFAIHTAWERWGTEIGVTNKRVIYKRGVISRYTAEMNMDKIETVLVDQTLMGRIFDYGAITIKGSGASIETLRRIAEPLALRAAITAR